MTGKEIVDRAKEIGEKSVYWYGGKRNAPSVNLAKSLKKQNPNVWNDAYYEAALKDIGSGKLVTDCSGLVCGAYGCKDIGTSKMLTYFEEYKGEFYIPGMIAWKKGHCGIILDTYGHIAEMRGLKWDFSTTRTFTECGFTRILYSLSVNYSGFSAPGHWFKSGTGMWMYRKSDALVACHEFLKINGLWYYFNEKGFMVTGYFRVNNKRYCSTENGLLKSSTVQSTELSAYELIH